MESRFDEIEKLLKKFASNGIIDKNDIYGELCNYGLSDEEKGANNSLVEDKNKILSLYKAKREQVTWLYYK